MAFDKDKYWENRKAGKAGTGEYIVVPTKPVIPPTANISFDNSGQMVVKNRAFRRQRIKLPTANQKKSKRK